MNIIFSFIIAAVLVYAFLLAIIHVATRSSYIEYEQPSGDDMDEHDFINQGQPFYHE